MDLFWQITIVEFLLNVAVFAAAVIAYGPVRRLSARLPGNSNLAEGLAVGALFGGATAIALLMPVHMSGGSSAGSQTVLLALAAPLAGPAAAIVAAIVAILADLFLWSSDKSQGGAAILTSAVSAFVGL